MGLGLALSGSRAFWGLRLEALVLSSRFAPLQV